MPELIEAKLSENKEKAQRAARKLQLMRSAASALKKKSFSARAIHGGTLHPQLASLDSRRRPSLGAYSNSSRNDEALVTEGQRARVKSDPIPKSDLIQPGDPIQSPKSDASGLKLRRGDNGDVPLVNLSTHREADTSERSSSSPMLRRGELLLSCSPMQHRLQPHAP